ncbi:MAG: type II secretion system protein GspG [Lentisphaeria bacterium]|nr:type II secretion system protein GspG [Lentisphaeria bacterium]
MKRLLFLLTVATVLCGCEADLPERFTQVCGENFGKTDYAPEKRITANQVITPHDMLEICITPLSSVIWKISLVIPDFPGDRDIIDGAKGVAADEFSIRFQKENSLLLPGTKVEISPAYEFGPRAVKIVFTDLEYEKLFIKENSLPETVLFRKKQQAQNDILLLEKALEAFFKDTGTYPEKLDGLLLPPVGVDNWRGPYWVDGYTLPPDPWKRSYVYRKNGKGFELFSTGESGHEVLR